MKDGPIMLGSKTGEVFGFTGDKFMDGSYLWKMDDYIYISYIRSRERGKGNLSKLIKTILDRGYGVKVPTPFPVMEAILIKKGFVRTEEIALGCPEPVEVWVKEKSK